MHNWPPVNSALAPIASPVTLNLSNSVGALSIAIKKDCRSRKSRRGRLAADPAATTRSGRMALHARSLSVGSSSRSSPSSWLTHTADQGELGSALPHLDLTHRPASRRSLRSGRRVEGRLASRLCQREWAEACFPTTSSVPMKPMICASAIARWRWGKSCGSAIGVWSGYRAPQYPDRRRGR